MAKSSFDKMEEFRHQRDLFYNNFVTWTNADMTDHLSSITLYSMMSKFLNFRTPTMGILDWVDCDAETLELLKALNGPNGYTIFKMLQIKKKHLQE